MIFTTQKPISLYKYKYPTNQREQMHLQPKEPRITRTYTIEPVLYEQVKTCANKDARVISRIIENYLTRYVQSRT